MRLQLIDSEYLSGECRVSVGTKQQVAGVPSVLINQVKSMAFLIFIFRRIIPVLILNLSAQPCLAQSVPELPPSQLTIPAGEHTFSFAWGGDTLQGEWNPHTALLLPVKLEGCGRQFYMQFDLGSPNSLFYRNKIKGIQEKYLSAQLTMNEDHSLKPFHFYIGNMKVQAGTMEVRSFDTTTLSSDTGYREIIGTLGADLIENKVLIMDYSREQITIADIIPFNLASQMTLTGFTFARRSVLLPAMILGKRTMLFFDTGSSAFQLLTNKETWQALAEPGAVPAQYAARSWNRMLMAHTISTHDSLTMAGQPIPIRKVTYVEGASDSQISMMMKLGIGGMTGNALFFQHILVLDTRHQQFGLLRVHKHSKYWNRQSH